MFVETVRHQTSEQDDDLALSVHSPGAPVQALFGRFGRGADVRAQSKSGRHQRVTIAHHPSPRRTQGHATQQARIQTLNRYGITTYDFGTRYLQQGCVGMYLNCDICVQCIGFSLVRSCIAPTHPLPCRR